MDISYYDINEDDLEKMKKSDPNLYKFYTNNKSLLIESTKNENGFIGVNGTAIAPSTVRKWKRDLNKWSEKNNISIVSTRSSELSEAASTPTPSTPAQATDTPDTPDTPVSSDQIINKYNTYQRYIDNLTPSTLELLKKAGIVEKNESIDSVKMKRTTYINKINLLKQLELDKNEILTKNEELEKEREERIESLEKEIEQFKPTTSSGEFIDPKKTSMIEIPIEKQVEIVENIESGLQESNISSNENKDSGSQYKTIDPIDIVEEFTGGPEFSSLTLNLSKEEETSGESGLESGEETKLPEPPEIKSIGGTLGTSVGGTVGSSLGVEIDSTIMESEFGGEIEEKIEKPQDIEEIPKKKTGAQLVDSWDPIHPDALNLFFGSSTRPMWNAKLFDGRAKDPSWKNLESKRNLLFWENQIIYKRHGQDLLVERLKYGMNSNIKDLLRENFELVQLYFALKNIRTGMVSVKLQDLIGLRNNMAGIEPKFPSQNTKPTIKEKWDNIITETTQEATSQDLFGLFQSEDDSDEIYFDQNITEKTTEEEKMLLRPGQVPFFKQDLIMGRLHRTNLVPKNVVADFNRSLLVGDSAQADKGVTYPVKTYSKTYLSNKLPFSEDKVLKSLKNESKDEDDCESLTF